MLLTEIQPLLLAVFGLTQGLTRRASDSRMNPQIERHDSAHDRKGNFNRALNSSPNDQDQGSFRMEEKVSKTNELLEKLIAIQEKTNQKLDEIIQASQNRDLATDVDRKTLNSKLDKIINCTELKKTQDHELATAQNETNEKLTELIEKTDISKHIVPQIESMLKNVSKIRDSVQMQKALNTSVESNKCDDICRKTKLHRFLHSKNRELLGMRPKKDISKPTIVVLAVNVYQIIEMNEAEEYLKANIHVNMTFYNEFLGWNPADFDEISETELEFPEKMWIPDIFAYNGMDMRNEDFYFRPIPRITTAFDRDNRNVIDSLATVEYTYPRIVKFSCSFDTFYFPFDYQLCVLTFRSWAHPRQKIYIVAGEHGKNYTKPNDEWDMKNISQKSILIKDKSSGEVFSVYQEEILVKRRPLYYIVNLIIPSIIITQVAFFGFFSPSSSEGDRTEKVNLGMGTLLAMSVLLLTVCGMTPVTSSHIPLMGIFFLTNMVLISFGIGTTTFIMAVHQRGKRKKRVPLWIQTYLFFKVAPLLGLKIPTVIRQANNLEIENVTNKANERKSTQCETLLLEQIPQVKQLSEHFESVIENRRRALAEVEYIFFAKILDGLMLLLFSISLYVCVGCVALVALHQNIPTVSEKQPMQWIAKIYKDGGRRLDGEFFDLFDMNRDGNINSSEFMYFYEKTFTMNDQVMEVYVHSHWPQFKESNASMNQSQVYQYFKKNREELGCAPYMCFTLRLKLDYLDVFDKHDSNFDSRLSEEEFANFCDPSNVYDEKPMKALNLGQKFRELDDNSRSTVCSCWFQSTDLDGNGEITAIELVFSSSLIFNNLVYIVFPNHQPPPYISLHSFKKYVKCVSSPGTLDT